MERMMSDDDQATPDVARQGEADGLSGLEEFDEQAAGTIRRAFHEGRWFFSVIDVVGLLTDSPRPRQYWFDMKRHIEDEGFHEVLAQCCILKLVAPDGKRRETDCADFATIVSLIHALPAMRRRARGPRLVNGAEHPICGVYAIVNTKTDEQYIGSSHDIAARFIQHQSLLRRGKHHAQRLQEVWDRYGEDAFDLIVLEELATSGQLAEREQWYLDTVLPAYNGASVANNSSILAPISATRIQHVLLLLYDIQSTATSTPLFRQLREALIYGVVTPGPNFQRLLAAEADGIATWTAFTGFLQQQAS
jgi:hypothetical protein